MGKVLIIGAGGVGSVVAHKCAQVPEVFSEIYLASRTLEKCARIREEVRELEGRDISVSRVDADSSKEVADLIMQTNPDIVINVALPYQDLSIMKACLETRVHYLDTANYEHPDEAKFSYGPQWDMRKEFENERIMALLGCGFDPGVTGVFTAYAHKHLFDSIQTLDILDCNGGSHGKAFATNFNLELNLREVMQPVKYWEGEYWKRGRWAEKPRIIDPGSVHFSFDYPEVGERESYLLYHEELESLVRNFPNIKRARFWMTFSENYLNYLRAFEELGLTKIVPIQLRIGKLDKISPKDFVLSLAGERKYGQYKEMLEPLGLTRTDHVAVETDPNGFIVPLQFLKKVLPEPSSLGENYTGKTVIGNIFGGVNINDGVKKQLYIYNVCDHAECYKEVRAQAISYTTGVPAMIGAKMILTGAWEGTGVFNVEESDPDPFMKNLNKYGLPWRVEEFKGRLYE